MKAAMKNTLTTLGFVAAVASSSLALGADVEYIADFGDDGDAQYFQVRCTDKRVVSLRVLSETKEACFATPNGEQCSGTWSVREAADQACR